jgi:dihydropteroate synthase
MDSWHSPHDRVLPVIGRRTLIMGVVNVTPDSFSDGGELVTPQALCDRAGSMIEAGADVLDIGGESTRPGAEPLSAAAELDRILPAITTLRRVWPTVPISVDTYKAAVADDAVQQGADIINDVWGLTHGVDREAWLRFRAAVEFRGSDRLPALLSPMAAVAARRKCPIIVMHNRPQRNYGDFWNDVLLDLRASLALGLQAGVQRRQLWTDPGFGFAKNVPQNLEVLRDLGRIVKLGYPVLVGTSRKSTIGAVIGAEVADRLEGGAATLAWAIQQGCHMVRVHDVREMARVTRMADAIKAGLDYSTAALHG